MKIAFLTKGINGGGSEKICMWLAQNLAKSGYCVSVLVLDNTSIRAEHPKLKIIPLKCRSLTVLPKLYKIFLKNQYDIVMSFGYELAVVAEINKFLNPIHHVTVFRNPNTISCEIKQRYSKLKGFMVRIVLKKFLVKTDIIVNQCAEMEDDLKEYLDKPSSKPSQMVTILNPAFLETTQSTKASVHFSDASVDYFLFAGRLELQKDLSFLLKAFSRYKALGGKNTLIIAGSGSLLSELQNEVRDLKLTDCVIFKGYVDDLNILMNRADALVLTSKYEGFPNVLLESLSVGTPVIVTRFKSGADEIVKNNSNGYLLDKSEDAFAHALLKFSKDNFSRLVLQDTIEKFSPEVIFAEYVRVIESLRH